MAFLTLLTSQYKFEWSNPSFPIVPSYKFFINSDNISLGELYKFPLAKKKFKNNFNLMELYNRNIINGEDNIGELLTGNADDNTEGIE